MSLSSCQPFKYDSGRVLILLMNIKLIYFMKFKILKRLYMDFKKCCFTKINSLILLQELQREKTEERNFLSDGVCPKCLLRPRLGQAKVRRQELPARLPCRCRVSSTWTVLHLPPLLPKGF